MSIPLLTNAETRAVVDALESGWVSSAGPMVQRFEDAIAASVGVRRAVATSSGTAAIHLALLALGIGPGDVVLVTPLTFVGTVNPIRYCGALPLFLDVDDDGALSASRLREYLHSGVRRDGGTIRDKAMGGIVRAVLPVHLYGLPPDMDVICGLASEFGIPVIEDATEALGTFLHGKAAGSFGRFGCLSFNGNKIITTGGGGMVLTQDDSLADRCRYLGTQARESTDEYVHNEIGYNYRLTSLQAALGFAQLSDLPRRVEHKQRLARRYRELLEGMPLRFLEARTGATANFWLSAVVLDDPDRRESTMAKLLALGIEVRSFFMPAHLQRPYLESPRWRDLRKAEKLHAAGLNLPSSSTLSEDDVAEVCRELRKALG